MTSFMYKPIGLEGPAVRLLRLLKGENEPIQGQLFESQLPPPECVGDYAALSYTWGSGYRPCEVLIDGSKMRVTKNAYLALRDLRYREKDRILWIDALCINQNDDKERGQQVQQMGSIYSKAERVIIWLGEATYDIYYVMRYMKQLEREGIKQAADDQKISDKQWVDIWSGVVHDPSSDQKNLLVEGLRSLLRRDWFKRVWIIQEVANARVAEIACGGTSVSGSIFTLTLSLLKIIPDPHCQPILDIMPGHLRNSSWWAEKRDLYTMLIKFCKSEATDPRDTIYALLGISSDACDSDFLKANYEKNLQDVIFDTTLFLLDLNELDFPICRFFDWTLPEFLKNLNLLASEVLQCAMKAGHVASVKLLMVHDDVDVDMKVSGRALLSWAAANDDEAVVKLLLEKGAVLEAEDDYDGLPLSFSRVNGQTPLSVAAAEGREAVVKLLLEKGAVLEAKDGNHRTPLSWAAARGQAAVVKLLLEKGAVLETKAKCNGETPLSYAAANGHEAVAKLLLERGAVLETEDRHGRTPLSRAAARRHKALVKLLLEKGAAPEAEDDYDWLSLS